MCQSMVDKSLDIGMRQTWVQILALSGWFRALVLSCENRTAQLLKDFKKMNYVKHLAPCLANDF